MANRIESDDEDLFGKSDSDQEQQEAVQDIENELFGGSDDEQVGEKQPSPIPAYENESSQNGSEKRANEDFVYDQGENQDAQKVENVIQTEIVDYGGHKGNPDVRSD